MNNQSPFFAPDPLVLRNKGYVNSYLCKPVVLILGFLQLAAAVIPIFMSSAFSSLLRPLNYVLNDLTYFLTGKLSSTNYFETYSSSFIVQSITIAIPAILFFLTFFCAKMKCKSNVGITALWVISIISLVFYIIVAIICAIAAIILGLSLNKHLASHEALVFVGGSDFYLTASEVTTTLTITLAVLVLVITISLFYGISQFKLASSLKKSLTTPTLLAKGAKAYGVINAVLAVFSCLFTIATAVGLFAALFYSKGLSQLMGIFIDSNALTTIAALSLVSCIINFACNIYTIKFAFGYSRHIADAGHDGINIPAPEPAPTYYQPTVQSAPQPFAPAENTPVTPYSYESVATTAHYPESGVTTVLNPEPGVTTVLNPEPEVTTPPYENESFPEVPTPAFCPECGTPIIPGQLFCSECGTKTE